MGSCWAELCLARVIKPQSHISHKTLRHVLRQSLAGTPLATPNSCWAKDLLSANHGVVAERYTEMQNYR
jgi:hypothetical protein